MNEKTPGGSKGLLESLATLAATLVAIAHTRLDLLSADLEEDREHLLSLLVLTLAALFCLGVGLVLATILLVVAFWDTHRILALSGLAGFFLAAGMAAGRTPCTNEASRDCLHESDGTVKRPAARFQIMKDDRTKN
jgi:uncharacterized membrane protein YqjE